MCVIVECDAYPALTRLLGADKQTCHTQSGTDQLVLGAYVCGRDSGGDVSGHNGVMVGVML